MTNYNQIKNKLITNRKGKMDGKGGSWKDTWGESKKSIGELRDAGKTIIKAINPFKTPTTIIYGRDVNGTLDKNNFQVLKTEEDRNQYIKKVLKKKKIQQDEIQQIKNK